MGDLIKGFSISPQSDTDIEGIIHHFPTIPVFAEASTTDGSNKPNNAINHSTTAAWISDDLENQWILINFTHHELFTSHYSVQSTSCGGSGCNRAKSWKVNGFSNGEWIEIDDVQMSKINGPLLIETRSVKNMGPFSAFQITSTGQNWQEVESPSYRFQFRIIDFFGREWIILT